MVASLIAAAISAAGQIYSSIKTANANRKRKEAQLEALDKSARRNENMYNYNMGMPRYATQTVLNQTSDILRERKAARTGAKNVVGGTQASVQAGNAQDTSMLNQATQSAISAGLDDRKQALKTYTEQQNNIDQQKAAVEGDYQQAVAQNNAAAAKGLASAAGQAIAAFDGAGGGIKDPTATKGVTDINDVAAKQLNSDVQALGNKKLAPVETMPNGKASSVPLTQDPTTAVNAKAGQPLQAIKTQPSQSFNALIDKSKTEKEYQMRQAAAAEAERRQRAYNRSLIHGGR